MMPKQTYLVRAGDYLKRVAHSLRLNADDTWNDPKNADLTCNRDPNILHPGDILFISGATTQELPVNNKATNRYVATVPMTTIQLRFKSDKGPVANEPYIIEGLGAKEEGTSDGSGMLAVKVPVHLREVRVTFPGRNITYLVRIGDMDPIDEPSGVRKRLQHLGYLSSRTEVVFENAPAAQDRQGIAAFQQAHGIEPTGELDDRTKAAILKEHGC